LTQDYRKLQEEIIELESKFEAAQKDLENAEEVLEQERQISADIQAVNEAIM
jgi:hypothetical protein